MNVRRRGDPGILGIRFKASGTRAGQEPAGTLRDIKIDRNDAPVVEGYDLLVPRRKPGGLGRGATMPEPCNATGNLRQADNAQIARIAMGWTASDSDGR